MGRSTRSWLIRSFGWLGSISNHVIRLLIDLFFIKFIRTFSDFLSLYFFLAESNSEYYIQYELRTLALFLKGRSRGDRKVWFFINGEGEVFLIY